MVGRIPNSRACIGRALGRTHQTPAQTGGSRGRDSPATFCARQVSQRIRTQGVHVDPMAGPPPPSAETVIDQAVSMRTRRKAG